MDYKKTLLLLFLGILFSLSFVSAYNNATLVVNSTFGVTGENADASEGVLYKAFTDQNLTKFSKHYNSAQQFCSIRDAGTGSLIANTTLVGNDCYVYANLTAGTTYRLMLTKTGTVLRTRGTYGASNYPAYGNFTGGCDAANADDDACTTSTISSTLYDITNITLQVTSSSLDIVQTSPANSSSFVDENKQFTATASLSNINATSSTLSIWNNDGTLFTTKLNNTLSGNNTNVISYFVTGLTSGSYKWSVNISGYESNDSTSHFNSNSVSNYTFSKVAYSIISTTFDDTVYETSWRNIQANISVTDGVLSVTSDLYYNGTRHPSSVTQINSSAYRLSNNLDIPLISTSGTNHSFLWEVSTTSSTETTTINSSTFSHHVNKTVLQDCSSTATNVTVNFTIYDSLATTNRLNSSFLVTFSNWLGSGNVKRNYSFGNSAYNSTSYKFCLTPFTNTTVHTDADIQFDGALYSINNHFYRNATLNNITLEQNLYLLNESIATLTKIKVVNTLQQPQVDRYVNVQIYDIGTGTFKNVAMIKTNQDGEGIVYLNWYDSFYRFIISYQGQTVYSSNSYQVSSTPQTFKIGDTTTFENDKFSSISYTLIYNNATNNFVLTFNDPTGRISGGCLKVDKSVSPSNYTTLYNQCEHSTSGTLFYNIGTNATGRYFATFYAIGSFEVKDIIELLIETSGTIYQQIGNLNGTIMAIILAGTAMIVGLAISPALGIFLMFGGYTLGIAMGFQSISFSASYILIFIAGLYLMWKVNK